MASPPGSEVWRLYETDGVPSSGPHRPDKSEIIAWAESLEDEVSDGIADAIAAASPPRGHLWGMVLSASGGTLTVSAGVATDSTGVNRLALGSSISKTTSAWAVGSGNGGLDTGSIGNSWYNVFVIKRVDTNVTDILLSLSPTAPTLPANYTLFRRIGTLQVAAGNYTPFVHDGDWFEWVTPILDYNATPGVTTAVLRALTVPPNLNVRALLNIVISDGSNAAHAVVNDPATADQASSLSASPLPTIYNVTGAATNAAASQLIRTNTSQQVRTRMSHTTSTLRIATLGWMDTRGRLY